MNLNLLIFLFSSTISNALQIFQDYYAECPTGQYYDTQTSQCADCSYNCNACTSATECTDCQTRFYLNNGACAACIANCDDCNAANQCTTCSSGCEWEASTTSCKQISCPAGQYYDTQTSQCADCSNNCTACTSATECQTCQAKFYINNGACAACIANCDDCNAANQCTTCSSGYEWEASTTSCKQISCPAGQYYDVQTFQCVNCISNCNECTGPNQCTTCSSGYYWDAVTASCTQQTISCEAGYYLNSQTKSCELCSTKTKNCLSCDANGNCLTCRGLFSTWLDEQTIQTTCTCPYGQIRVFNATTLKYVCASWKTTMSQFNYSAITKLGQSITLNQLKQIYSLTLYLNQYEHEIESPTQTIANHLLYSQGSIFETSEKINVLSQIFTAFGLLPIKSSASYNTLLELSQPLLYQNLSTQAINNLFEFAGLLSEKIGKNGGLDYGTQDSDTIIYFLNNAQNFIDSLKQKAFLAYSQNISSFKSFRFSNLWIGISVVNKYSNFQTSLVQNQFKFSATNNVVSQLNYASKIWFIQIVQEINLFQYLPQKFVNMGSSLQNVQFFVENSGMFTPINNLTNISGNVVLTFQMNSNQYNATLYNYISADSSWTTNGQNFNLSANPISLSDPLFGIQAKWINYSCNQGEYQFSYNQCEVCEYMISGCLNCDQQTGDCQTCSGLAPAWKNVGSQQKTCTCPTGYMIVKNSSFFCANSTLAAGYWQIFSARVMAMSGSLTNDQLKLLQILTYSINGENSLIYLNIIVKKFVAGINLNDSQQIQLAAEILLGFAQNNQSSYQILNTILYIPHQIAVTTYCNSTILNTLMEFFGLVFQKISQPTFDFSNATSTAQALFLDNIVLQFKNVKRIYLSNTNITPNSYHFSNIYLNVFKGISISQNFNSKLFQDQFQIELDSQSIQLLASQKPISALHLVVTQNFYANYPFANATIPSNLMQIDFYQGLNYQIANSKLKNLVIYANKMTFSYLWNSKNIALNYWTISSPLSRWNTSNDFLYLYSENNITCHFESLSYSTIYGLKITN